MIKDRFKEIYSKLFSKSESFIKIMMNIINELDTKDNKYAHNKK